MEIGDRSASVVKVRIQYLGGCPNWIAAEQRLREALDFVGDATAVERYLVETQEEAERLGFGGSPSILLDGRDPFPTGPGSCGLTCRLYSTPDGPRGSPTLEQFTDAIHEATSS
jgi:hypothetical protein